MMIRKRIIGTIVGVGLCLSTIMAVEKLGHSMLGVPQNTAQATIPMLLWVLAAWTLGPAVGGFIGTRIAQWAGTAWIIGGLVALGVFMNQAIVPTPLWLSTAGICLTLLTARLVAHHAQGQAGSSAEPTA